MKFALIYCLVAIATAAAAGIIVTVWFPDWQHDGDCTAPCVVHFSKPMAEDNFKIDYRGDGTRYDRGVQSSYGDKEL